MTPYDCQIFAPRGGKLSFSVAGFDGASSATVNALIDPYGYVFDSRTGAPVDGARVTLVDQETGLPAKVFGDDGFSVYPSSVISGHDVVDEGGSVYQSSHGQYRFPLTAPGRYALFIEPPQGYTAPSLATAQDIAKLTSPEGGDFIIADASWGAAFDLTQPEPLQIDIPLDSGALPVVVRSFSQASRCV